MAVHHLSTLQWRYMSATAAQTARLSVQQPVQLTLVKISNLRNTGPLWGESTPVPDGFSYEVKVESVCDDVIVEWEENILTIPTMHWSHIPQCNVQIRYVHIFVWHYGDVIMSMASQIISHTILYSTVYSGADQRKHQSSASLAFVRGIHR